MIQQINLYQTGSHENHVPFSANQMASVLAAVFLLIIAAGIVDHWRLSALASELSRLHERQGAAVQRINDFQQKYSPRAPDDELVRQVNDLVNVRQATLELLQLMNDSQLGNHRGLSDHLSGLARKILPTVWLRRIRISAGGEHLLIEGSSTRAADVPRYLQRLNEQAVFTGREFERLQLTRAEKKEPIIDFMLQTTPEIEP